MVVLSGEIMTMPGLPKIPASENIDADGNIVGLAQGSSFLPQAVGSGWDTATTTWLANGNVSKA
jgi:hypothetical protein